MKMLSVFEVVPETPLKEYLDIPDTQYLLYWNHADFAYEVRDICGWKNLDLTRQVRRMLGAQNVASMFPMVGKVVQGYAKALAA